MFIEKKQLQFQNKVKETELALRKLFGSDYNITDEMMIIQVQLIKQLYCKCYKYKNNNFTFLLIFLFG